VEGPRHALLETALNGKGALVRRIGEFDLYARGRIRQDERLANFKILNDERVPLEQLHTRFQRHLDEFNLDVGVTYLDNEPLARVRSLPLYHERYMLVTRSEGPFRGRDAVSWSEAAGLPLCLLTPYMQNRRILDMHFHEAGATLADPLESLDRLLVSLTALCGFALDDMTQDDGWRMLMLARRLERIQFLAGLLAAQLTERRITEHHVIGVAGGHGLGIQPLEGLVETGDQGVVGITHGQTP